ncbi:late competence development ComFB family protein [Filibacter tadaridae]|uniref:Late competence development protein ComFB n=1 Tax=Filibacter tadaridae TaxID=2483811 RepID=A0A3P5WY79_9BACL|nr:late competence development ComFB family protein [Filibacter tadaridae]VDC24011.1 Late competence development protein ComFB [Filibacter tadaridae]
MAIHNVMEDVVHDVLHTYKDQLLPTCNCERCMEDIMAIALNQLPARYIVDEKYSPYIRATHETDRQGATNILATVTHAATLVSKNPRCPTMNPDLSEKT